ncbi:MAG TPA: hypothetical protein VEL76_27755 [Gemmataceae bacterium]|nr:hypothetical protein [Gemmataceae bacterium]
MKDVVIQDAIRNDPETLATVEQATQLLEAELGSAASLVKAEWVSELDEHGRRVIALTLSDWTGAVGTRFGLEELKNQHQAQARLHALWGDLLQVRSHEQLKKLSELIKQL